MDRHEADIESQLPPSSSSSTSTSQQLPQPTGPPLPPPNTEENPSSTSATSPAGEKTANNCRNKNGYYLLGIFLVLVSVAVVFMYILAPKDPKFLIEYVTVSNFTVSSGVQAGALTSNFNITISSRNPSSNTGLIYRHLHAYAEYRSQRITAPEVPLSPSGLYQAAKDDSATAWSLSLAGDPVRVSEALLSDLESDMNTGIVNVTIHVKGDIRAKSGSLKSVWWGLHVNCLASLPLGNGSAGVLVVGGGFKFALGQPCSVEREIFS